MGTQSAKCPACREPALRVKFGCDEKARWPVWTSTCPSCLGTGCDVCEKAGELHYYRCPNSMTNDDGRRALEFAMAYENGFLPDEGPYGRQVNSGMTLINLVRMERAKIQRAAQESTQKDSGSG